MMKRIILGWVALVISLGVVNKSNASAIGVSYTVSGSPGNYDLDFSVTNNMTAWNQNIYFFGVSLTDFNVTNSPSPFISLGATNFNFAFYGGSSNQYNNNWQADPTFNDLLPGNTLSGFVVHDTALVAPTAVPWFAFSQNSPGHNNEPYTGGENFNHAFSDSNPGFEGIANPKIPEPSAFVMSAILLGILGMGWGCKQLRRSLVAIRILAVGIALFVVELGAYVPAKAALLSVTAGTSALTPSFLNGFNQQTGTTGPVSTIFDKQENFRGVLGVYAYNGSGSATANYLSLGASSHVILNDYTPLDYVSNDIISSTAQTADDITVPGSGSGFVQFLFHLSGSAASTNPSLVQGGVFFNANINSVQGVSVNSFSLGSLPLGDLQTGLIPITFGVPFHISTQLQTIVEAGSGTDIGPIDAGIFYGNTAAFKGMNAFDASGNPLTSFTTLSDSGTDYAHIVPEPSTWALLAAGAGTLFVFGRRKGKAAMDE